MQDMLIARVPGLRITRGSRGRYSLNFRNGAGEALLVLDGTPVRGDADAVLAAISPHDVQRIEVLKGAYGAMSWGMRGSNGVIVITTRRGPTKEDEP
jgi:iron complex outermembrane receptor protein